MENEKIIEAMIETEKVIKSEIISDDIEVFIAIEKE